MEKNGNKVALIGAGAVGTSFLYALINQGLATDYILIDAFLNAAEGNALDLADTMAVLPSPFASIKAGDYQDLSDTDVLVITAGRPQKPGETRLEMVADNAKIMKEIGEKVKKSGFKGITVIASNPVDVLTTIYQEVTGFDPRSVIGSGTTLDSARLRRLLGAKLNVGASSVNAYLLGEHGDSAVAIWSHASIIEEPLESYLKSGQLSTQELKTIRDEAVKMAYKIIELKHATYYGIGACLARIVKAILHDEKATLIVGAKVNGQYQTHNLYIGVPAIISAEGCENIIEWDLNAEELEAFKKSAATLKNVVDIARKAIV